MVRKTFRKDSTKVRTILFLVLLAASGLTAAGKTMSARSLGVPAARNQPRSTAVEDVFNLADFGAVGDGVADAGPALQNALNAIGQSGGGTLFVPAGRYAIITPVYKNFTGLASDVSILGVESLTPVPPPNSSGQMLSQGLDLTSEFAPRTGQLGVAINITGLQSFLIKDIVFIGTAGVDTDALITLALDNIRAATIRHCEFYGLSSLSEGGSIVQSIRSGLNLEQSVFLGCTANSGVNDPVVQNIEWKSITVAEAIFIDYGQRPELFGKLGLAAPFSWINIGNAAELQSDSPRREVVIRSVFLDEGGLNGISSTPYRYLPASAPIDLLYVSGLYMNVSNLGTSGNYLYGPERVLIENSHYGWSHNADAAINLLQVGNAILDRVECVASADRIRADSATNSLTVIDSVYNHLDSLAQNTRVITTAAPDEDPVQYVRGQFTTTLGRPPDPAAHFYWSDQILQCGDNLECIAAKRAALGSYLDTLLAVLEFGAPSYSVSEGAGTFIVTVKRTGTTSSATEVTYSGVDASAQQRSDVIPVIGRLRFEPGETSKSFIIFITDDAYVEGNESIKLELGDLVGGTLGNNSTATLTIVDNDTGPEAPNPIDDAQFFVSQHYRDFLNRPPDAEGLAFWSNQILSCGTDAACIDNRRINVSAAFFLSIEFQETGFLVYRLYQVSFAQTPEHLNEFLLDTRTIGEGVVVNAPGWQQLLEANKTEFIKNFVARPEFTEAYPLNLSPAEFVNLLNLKAGGALSPDEVASAVGEFQGAATSQDFGARARALRRVAENQTFSQRQLNAAFVLMQYYGYLQRNPSEAPDTNLDGYNFWLTKLNEHNGNFIQADMVKSFLVSDEYRARFGAH
jgi:hypothetical protein